MKRSMLHFLMLCMAFKASATVLQVNNNTGATATYTQVDAALANAFPGDTIYVYGSNITYATFTITKSIVIIGPGTFSDKQNSFAAKVNSITSNNNISGITIKGLTIVADIAFNSKSNLTQIEIAGNYFNANSNINFIASSGCGFINIHNNIFSANGIVIDFFNNTGISNVMIQNNLVFGSVRSLNAPSSLVSHNVFINTPDAFDANGASLFTGIVIKDNIFYNSNPINNTTSCTYDNNLSFSTTLTYPNMPGTGNLNNVNPNFVNVLSGNYTPAFNFNLTAVSPAKGTSSTGDDMGFYGGSMMGGVSGEMGGLPAIRRMDVINPNVPYGGNLNVNVRTTKAR